MPASMMLSSYKSVHDTQPPPFPWGSQYDCRSERRLSLVDRLNVARHVKTVATPQDDAKRGSVVQSVGCPKRLGGYLTEKFLHFPTPRRGEVGVLVSFQEIVSVTDPWHRSTCM